MNKTSIKNFAVWARTNLLHAVRQRAFEYEITEEGELDARLTAIGGRILTEEERKQRRELIERIREDGYKQVMEQTAYIWFNRFIALRFMEVNGYLPSRVRLFTDDNGEFRPAVLKEAMNLQLDGLDREKVYNYLEKQDNEGLYKYLLLTQCNALNRSLPYMFEKIDNYTELLFPNGLLKPDSVIGKMVSEIPEEDWTDQVQIIGWLYQYYNSELKDETFAELKKNVKISKEKIPAATQLFTPDWIVRYMVENSLGRLWLEGHPNDSLKEGWKYYLEEAKQEPEVEARLAEIRKEYENLKPEEIRVIDPCMGSGHILVAAFDVLMDIYTSCGWSERDAAKSIVENNLYGLDIDDRAGQLAYFSVMMEARKYNRRALNGELKPNLMAIEETRFMTGEMISYVANGSESMAEDLAYLKTVFYDGKEYGSILTVKPVDFEGIYRRLNELETTAPENLLDHLARNQALEYLRPILRQAEMLSGEFDVVVTNPPYMGGSGMDTKLNKYVKENYPDSKSDLFAVFIERCGEMTADNRYQAMITQHAWMFLSSYEKLRGKLLNVDIISMAHLGARAFEEIGGEVVQTTSFVMQKRHEEGFKGNYCRLIEPTTQQGKEDMFLAGENRYEAQQANFAKIPGSPVAYWVSEKMIRVYSTEHLIGDDCDVKIGMGTGKNEVFVREWWEVFYYKIDRSLTDISQLNLSPGKYFPYNKGGDFRKWYGNLQEVLWFDELGRAKMKAMSGHRENGAWNWYCKEGITWSFISSSKFGIRHMPYGCFYDVAGSTLFSKVDNLYTLGFLSSNVCFMILGYLNPTLNYQAGNIKNLPIVYRNLEIVNSLVEDNISHSRYDWDSYETSWDFRKHPLVPNVSDNMTKNTKLVFSLKIGEEKWIQKLQSGAIWFGSIDGYIKKAEIDGNDEQGDRYEGIFARCRKGCDRIDEMQLRFGNDLEIIDDGDYCFLRRRSSRLVNAFCMYVIKNIEGEPIGEPYRDSDGQLKTKLRYEISPKMYHGFLQNGKQSEPNICGYYCSVGHLHEEIQKKLSGRNFYWQKYTIKYDIDLNKEFFIEPGPNYPELGHKRKELDYQNECRYIIIDANNEKGTLINIEPLSESSGAMARGELYMIGTAILEEREE